ncbi:MAG: ATP-binding protein [Synergistaceae bacterium]|nr:ATP-binding protein [Synergistaceae bacterium]
MATRLAEKLPAFTASPDWKSQLEALRAKEDAEALDYLHAKFPGIEDSVFFTDYTGYTHAHVIDAREICQAAIREHACASCKGHCTLTDRESAPVPCVEKSSNGFMYLYVRWACNVDCRFDPLSGQFGRLFTHSGLIQRHLRQTFENYAALNDELTNAQTQAIFAAMNGTGLVLAGKRGTGKTHLAVAIALYAMRHGKQALFRLVNDLLNEIRKAVADHSDYFSVIQKFKEVPCLVLDDFGKEKTTDAGLDYLYSIVDYRYQHELQTIITTNAPDIETLASWGKSEYTTPIVSRVMESGAWVTLAKSDDYRVKGAKHNAHR